MTEKEIKNNRRIADEVADLYVRMEAQESTADDLRQLMAWAADDPEKLNAFEKLNRVWEATGDIRPDEAIIHGPENILQAGLWGAIRWKIPAQWGRMAAMAGAAAVLLVFGLLFVLSGEPQSYRTTVGELRQVALTDGSQIHLNGSSEVTVDYAGNRRYLVLDRGEAYFEVAHDRERAFVVEVGGVLVKAVGTAFNIDYTGEDVTVSVVEGTVQVELSENLKRHMGGDTPGLYASVGEQVAVQKNTARVRRNNALGKVAGVAAGTAPYVLRKDPASSDQSLAWRKGVLNLDGESLAKAVERINRQSSKQVAISDIRLRDLPIYGSFHLDNVSSFIQAVEVLYPIRHIETEQGYLLSYRD